MNYAILGWIMVGAMCTVWLLIITANVVKHHEACNPEDSASEDKQRVRGAAYVPGPPCNRCGEEYAPVIDRTGKNICVKCATREMGE